MHNLAIGIDLGTTYSLVATMINNQVTVLPDENGQLLLPSIVYYGNDKKIVGVHAQQQLINSPLDTIQSVKRLIGRTLKDINLNCIVSRYNLKDIYNGESIGIETSAGIKTPIEVSSNILEVLRIRSENILGANNIKGAVITVPAYFDDIQRQATKNAAELANINVLRLINEPTAAAIAYGLNYKSTGVFAVYDLGGGTFDFSILKLSKGIFEVIATCGDIELGGDDFDRVLIDALKVDIPYLNFLNDSEYQQLLAVIRKTKENLSINNVAQIEVIFKNGNTIKHSITESWFTQISNNLIQRTFMIVRKALRDANLHLDKLDGIVLAGGATRMRCIRNAVQNFFKQSPLCHLNPDQVVVSGAAMHANLLICNKKTWVLLDVVPLSLGVETIGGLVEKIIPRNSTIPVSRTQEFTTFKDNQTAIIIHVVQGEGDLANDCRSLARFKLTGISPMAAGLARVKVTYKIDTNGILFVEAQEITSGVISSITVKPSYRLNKKDISEMISKNFSLTEHNKHERILHEYQIKARKMLNFIESSLKEDKDLLKSDEIEVINIASNNLNNLLIKEEKDVKILEIAINYLTQVTTSFMALRTDKNIRNIITKQHLINKD